MNMKLKKYFWGLFIAVIAGLTSCNTDVEGEYYPFGNVDGQLISFESGQYAVQIPKEESSVIIPVKLVRSNAEKALTVELATTASQDGIFTLEGGNSISFQPGQQTATFNVIANNLEKEVPYGFAISLDDKAVIDTLFLENSTSVTYKTFIPGVEDLENPEESTKDTIVIDTVKTNYYVANPVRTMQISVTREGDWTEWQPWNSEGTATFIYVNYWEGEDQQDFVYRQNLITTNRYQFKMSNWGGGIDLFLEYDEATGHVTCPAQFTGYTHSSYGELWVTDRANYKVLQGGTPSEDDYGTFDKEQGIFVIPLAYYVSAGYFGYDPEYLYIDGIERGDYTSSLSYIGVLTNADNEVFAVGNLELGPDATDVKAIVMPQDADADAVADALASGDLEGYDVEAGQIMVPIPEDFSGKLKLIVAVISDGVVKSVSTAGFEYYGGSNPWVSLGKGIYTDNLVCTLYDVDPITYEVEVFENTSTPGLYKLAYPYGEVYPYNEEGDWDTTASYDIEIDATDPDGVVLYEQATGADWGYGMMTIQSVGAYYNVVGGYDLAMLKERGYLGTLKDGVITLPIFTRDLADGSTAQYQGFLGMGGKSYYSGSAGEFKLILPGSSAMNGAKKKLANKKNISKNKTFRGVSAQKIVKNNRLHTLK